jgi:hypothetical protein
VAGAAGQGDAVGPWTRGSCWCGGCRPRGRRRGRRHGHGCASRERVCVCGHSGGARASARTVVVVMGLNAKRACFSDGPGPHFVGLLGFNGHDSSSSSSRRPAACPIAAAASPRRVTSARSGHPFPRGFTGGRITS